MTTSNNTTYTNQSNQVIEFKPFMQDCLGVWRVAKFEDSDLYMVYESKAFDTEQECLEECVKNAEFYRSVYNA